MFSKIPALKLARKAAAATVVCGAVALGGGGIASAATSSATPAATGHHRCARAPKALARISKAETALSTRVAKLQAAETKATNAGHTKLAARVENRITHLQALDTKASNLAAKISAKCQSGSSS